MKNCNLENKKERFKVGFLCIKDPHFVHHMMGMVVELSKVSNIDVHLYYTVNNHNLIQDLLDINNANVHQHSLYTPKWIIRFLRYVKGLGEIYRRVLIHLYKGKMKNVDSFVVPTYNYLFLKKKFPKTKLVFCEHGISNRAYSFDQRITKFDLFFLTGLDEKKCREERNQVKKDNSKMVGFLKYDVVKNISVPQLFRNKNKSIIYNPHWEWNLTSFYKFGIQILEYFSQEKKYNLIFAPHSSSLYVRNFLAKKKLAKYSAHSNIIIDFGSERGNDMTYTKYADLYLGDVSSQSLEFLFIKPRPMLFLDAHELENDKINRPISWDLGDVINSVDNLEHTIDKAFASFNNDYLSIQKSRSEDLFFKGKKTPSALATEAIIKLINRTK